MIRDGTDLWVHDRAMIRLNRLQMALLTWILAVLSCWLALRVGQMFGTLLTNILTAAVLAFLLNYPVRILCRYKIPRGWAVTVTFTLSVVILSLVGVALIPVLARQVGQLGAKLPLWVNSLQMQLEAFSVWAAERNIPFDQSGLTDTLIARLQVGAEKLAGQSLELLLGTFGRVVDLVLILVLALYMLLYGDMFWRGLLSLIPAPWGSRIGGALVNSFQNFLIGQLVLGLIMGVMLVPAFAVIHVPFGLLFGLLIGLLEVIPLVGGFIGIGAVSGLLAFQDVWLAVNVVIVSLIVQQIKDRVLAPRIMGDLTGLNPVWILVALLVGAQLGGILGVIVAIPITSVVKGLYQIARSADQEAAMVVAGSTSVTSEGIPTNR
ncbi:MAG: AI-2E family transporter [Synechococcales cyanobacterium]